MFQTNPEASTWPPQTALIVGGASGMGAAIATALINLGTRVLVADRNVERMNAWRESAGDRAEVAVCDITSDESVAALATTAEHFLGTVDLLVSTPGVAVLAPPHKVPIENWCEVIDVNLLGAVRIVNVFLTPMLERGRGTIMLTGSEAGFRPQSWALGVYGTTKAALNSYAENLAVYTRGHGVHVSLLCPGVVESNFGESARMISIDDPAAWATLGPSPRPIPASDVATAALDGLREGRFLIATHPEFIDELRELGADLDQALAARSDTEGVSALL